ncbi:baseplate J/gp47 family protein [Thermosulfuriphilus sp.]
MEDRFSLDPRTAQEIYSELKDLARIFLPEWRLERDPLGRGLLRTVAEIWGEFLENLNRIPEKTFLDFLRHTGLRPQGPKAARGIVVFTLNERAPGPITIPARSKVAAGEVIFETEGEFLATPARLKALISTLPEKDAYFNHLKDLEKGRPFRPFEGENLQRHVLYLGAKESFLPGGRCDLLLEFDQELPALLLREAFSWWAFDGRGWMRLEVQIAPYLPLPGSPTGPPLRFQGAKADWFGKSPPSWKRGRWRYFLGYRRYRACLRLPQDLGPATAKDLGFKGDETAFFWIKLETRTPPLPPLSGIYLITSKELLSRGIPDFLTAGGRALPPESDQPLRPFGHPPVPGTALYLGLRHPVLPEQRFRIDLEGYSYTPGGLFMARVSETQGPPLSWEFFDGQGWQHLPGSWSRTEGSLSFSFTSPSEIRPSEINGHQAYWLRLSYQGTLPLSPQGPGLSFNGLAIVAEGEKLSTFEAIWAENSGNIEKILENRSFFTPLAGEKALYFGLNCPLTGGPYQLYLDLEERPREPVPVIWEALGPQGWQEILAFDETDGLSHSGLWRLNLPQATTETRCFGIQGHWLRARLPQGMEGRWKGAHFNAVRIKEGETFEEKHPLKGLPGEEVALSRAPLVELKVFVKGEPWLLVDDLSFFGPEDKALWASLKDGIIRFGDGQKGALPPAGDDALRVVYRVGGGPRGNVAPQAIDQAISGIPFLLEVNNPLPTTGGAAAEDKESLIKRGPQRLRHRGRLITSRDLEEGLEQMEEISRAKVLEEGGHLNIYLLPASEDPRPWPSPQTLKWLRGYLPPRLPLTVFGFRLSGPEYWEVWIWAEIITEASVSGFRLTEEASQRITSFLHPVRGGYEGRGWPFGRLPFRSDFLGLLHQTEGILEVKRLKVRLRPPGRSWITLEDDISLIPFPPYGLVTPGPVSISLGGSR